MQPRAGAIGECENHVFIVERVNEDGTYLISETRKTVSYALSQITASGISRAGVASAASIIVMIVPIVTFIISQSNVVETMAASGIKE